MLEKFRYVNHKGQELSFGNGRLFVNANDLRDYEWEYTSKRGKLQNFKRAKKERSIPVRIVGKTQEEARELKNKLFEVTEVDVIENSTGKLYIGDYYLPCVVVGSTKEDYNSLGNYLAVTLSLASADGKWIRESFQNFTYTEDVVGTKGHGYPYGYDYGYGMDADNISTITNSYFGKCGFVMAIDGSCVDPMITIGGNIYQVHCDLGQNEQLIIDSVNKRVYIQRDGYTVNMYANRDREHYVFEPIKAGENYVHWNGEFNWSITLYEERSEPAWT